MPLPTPDQFLAKLAASPTAAAAFDAATRRESPGKTRREAVEACHKLATATLTANAALKAQVAASKAKVAALEVAKLSQSNLMKTTTPPPTKAPQATITASHTAASFATPAVTMTRSEFDKLTPSDKARFFKTGGKLV
jgi:hypothetical protein